MESELLQKLETKLVTKGELRQNCAGKTILDSKDYDRTLEGGKPLHNTPLDRGM